MTLRRRIAMLLVLSVANGHAIEAEPPILPSNMPADRCAFESALISIYKSHVKKQNAQFDFGSAGLSPIQSASPDGASLHGAVWRAKNPIGFLLVAQGNATLASQVYLAFKKFTTLGLDVYLYDYRGFGQSTGETSLQGIVDDYARIWLELSSRQEYKTKMVYAFSFGGVVMLRVNTRSELGANAVIFDSTPNSIPFCPASVDPAKNLPDVCPNWLIIAARPDNDKSVGSRADTFLQSASKKCGAKTFTDPALGHIFMDSEQATRIRLDRAYSYFRDAVEKNPK